MENTLRKLLSSEKQVMDEGTKELKEILQSPNSIASLCSVLGTCKDPELRQYAAVILKKSFSKQANWEHIPGDTRKEIKAGILETLINEPEKLVKNSIAQLIGTLLKHEVPANRWPEFSNFLQQSTTSSNVSEQELGFYTLSVLLDVCPMEFLNHAKSFTLLFANVLQAQTDKASHVSSLVITCMIHFSAAIKNDRELVSLYANLLPMVMEVIKALSVKRPEHALDALDFFYEYSEKDGFPVLMPHIETLVQFFLVLSSDGSISEEIRIKALGFLSTLVKVKAKALTKKNLIPPILSVLFELMCSKPEDDEEEEYFTSDPEEDTLLTCACETLDNIALSVDAKKLIGPVMEFVRNAIMSANPYQKKGGYLTLGIVSQGCEAYIRRHCLQEVVDCVQMGVAEPHPVVRAAALFALGQFAEYLQPEISVHGPKLLPILISQIQELNEVGKSGESLGKRVDRLFYAVERFAENLEEELGPFTEALVNACLPLFQAPYSLHIRQLSMSCIATLAGSVKEGIMPYFPNIMNQLNAYLINKAEGDDISLQVEALDTLGAMARNVGEDNFRPLALESVQLGLTLIQSTDDPDIKKSCFSLFACVSCVLKDNMGNLLQDIMPFIIKSLQEEVPTDQDSGAGERSNFPTLDALCGADLDDDDDEDDEDYCDDISVENDYVEEKEEACLALGELASNTGQAFFPYLETSFSEVYKLLEFNSCDVRKAALEAAFQFCISFSKFTEADIQGDEKLKQVVANLVVKAAELITKDDDSEVVQAALEGYQLICKEIGVRLKGSDVIKETLVKTVKDVLNNKTEVQGWGEEDEEENEVEVGDTAAYVIPALANIMDSNEFADIFSSMLDLLDSRLKAKDDDEGSEEYSKANTIGVIAESMPGLGVHVPKFIDKLFPYLLNESRNEDPDVRNNALFCIGEMAYHGKESMFPHYTTILGLLSQVLSSEGNSNVMDNACGVLARLLLVHADGLPLAQILPTFVVQLPLKEDFSEDKWVFRALGHLYQLQVVYLLPHNVKILKAALISIDQHSPDEETSDVLRQFLTMMIGSFPDDFNVALSELPQNVVNKLNSLNLNNSV
ncbi:hypothetical protein GE061_016511 [Apolygus lucorum]|uniref:Uncharacterized protein n=1 Tax=Apolygus lucorum TaxID=248454 RepID=A0A6A4JMH3_APOLU|nr:hypothetical protein GE061_016511 [Apolygus lucorum]